MSDKPFDSFRNYVPSFREKTLTIFMPYVHPTRTLGMAESFGARGHKLMLSDESSIFKIATEAAIAPDEARRQFGSNVSSYCNNEIFETPPDVIIVGSTGNEEDCFKLYDLLVKKKPTAIIAMSGNFHSPFNFKHYDGLICCDLATRILARCMEVPAIRYVEATWLDDFPASRMPREERFFLRSFINDFAKRYPLAHEFQRECVRLIANTYGERVVAENLEWLPREEVRRLMIGTPMILHVKDQEGYGWALIESLFIGRPIIYQEGLARDMAFKNWIEPGVSGFPIQQPSDLIPIIDKFKNDLDELDVIHARTAEIVRERYDGPEVAEDMVQFVVDLHRIARMRWIPNRMRAPNDNLGWYRPSLDLKTIQDYEQVWSDVRSSTSQ